MAPTKNVSDLSKKVANKRASKAKPEKKDLKTPTIKLKFANIYVKPPKIERKVTSQRKIELANEVAQEQLTKSSECSPKVLPSPVTKAPINAEPEATKIQPTSKRKRKTTPKLAAIASSSDAIPLVKKTIKHKEKAKARLKDTKILAKGEHTNAVDGLESKSSVIMKKPGPQSKTMPLAEQKILEIPTQETISLKKKTRKSTVAKTTTVQNSEDFDRSANKWEDVIDPPPVKKSQKRKKSSVKLETGTMEGSEETTAKKSRGKTLNEFTSQRLKGNKLKVTRVKDQSMHTKAVKGAATMLGQSHEATMLGQSHEAPAIPGVKDQGMHKKAVKGSATILGQSNVGPKIPGVKDQGMHKKAVKGSATILGQSHVAPTIIGVDQSMHKKAVKGTATMLGQSHEAAPVRTRSNSVHSINSNLSWTKDISSSSSITCLTVSSNDFVRFDKKLPFVHVENVDYLNIHLKEDNIKEKLLENDSWSSSSSSKTSDSSSITDLHEPVDKPDLNLSTSSLTTKSLRSEDLSKTELLNLKLAEILNSTKTFYKDLNKWIAYDDDDTVTFSTLLEARKIEKDLITDCENFGKLFNDGNIFVSENSNLKNSSDKIYRSTKDDEIIYNYKEVVNNQDGPETSQLDFEAGPRDSDGGRVKNREKFPVNIPDIATEEKTHPVKSNSSSETFTSDNYNYLSFDDKVCDDEDALSIFAESITGIESSRMSTVSNMSVQEPRSLEVYVPKPTRPWIQERYTYQPTRIGKNWSSKTSIANNNADSSSIHSETDLVMKAKVLLGDANRMSSLAIGAVLPEAEPAYNPHRGSEYPEFEQANKPHSGSEYPEFEQANTPHSGSEYPEFEQANNPHIGSEYPEFEQANNPHSVSEYPEFEQANNPHSGSEYPEFEQANNPHSGSEYPEFEQANNPHSGSEYPEFEQANEPLCGSADLEAEQANNPPRMFTPYKETNPMKSTLYRGCCFFNLSTQCKNTINCRYPHVDIDINVFVGRLATMSDANLICEYLLTVRYKSLRRNFGLLFIKECKRREATRILMEIAIDLGLGVLEWEDHALQVSVLETALLHLNTVSCDKCVDLLMFEHNGTMMCDALMSCMANSQNFAQFKRAFEKLASFMVQIQRPVDIDIVGKILERVCILPAEDSLARGMLCLMQNTSPRIFNNRMANSFETQLSNIDSKVLESYVIAKKAALPALPALMARPLLPPPAHDAAAPREGSSHLFPAGNTDFDNLNSDTKATTKFNRTISGESIRHLFKSPTTPAPKQRFSAGGAPRWRRGAPPPRGRLPLARSRARRPYPLTDNCNCM